MIPQFQVRYHDGKDDTCFTAFLRCPYTMEKNLYRQTTVGYWFCMFVTNSLSRRTGLQINLRQLHSVPCATRYASLPAPTSCVQAFTHKRFYTQTLLHTDAFTHRRFYTQTLLHTKAFTHRRFYTQTLLHAGAVKVHTKSFTHKRFYTWCFYTNTL